MNCECAYCKNKLPFTLPDELIESAQDGSMIIFAGAGISTETKLVFKNTLYEDILEELNLNSKDNISFPDLMTMYCNQKNGRKLLLEKIRKRFEYCLQYSELYQDATKFHCELSSIFSIDKIFTTNWDNYFELECSAIPFVTAEDFAFYNITSRKVFKIHGSISNYGSIIATKNDYNKCYKNLKSGLMGSYLKTMLATSVVVFIGFSFNDFDFNKIYSYLKKEMKEVIPHIYIISIDKSFINKYDEEKVTLINTDGSYFISTLRTHLEGLDFLIPKKNLQNIDFLSYKLYLNHIKMSNYFYKNKTPTNLFNLQYQDGIKHAFDFLIYHSKSGLTFNRTKIINSIDWYNDYNKKMLRNKNYQEYVYTEGYITGLYGILLEKTEIEMLPLYFIPGYGHVHSFNQYKKLLTKNKIYHKSADKYGKKYYKDILSNKTDIIFHHRPFL